MADLKIYPTSLKGEVKIPPSKSMAHRAVICAALGNGISKVSNIDMSDDIIATSEAMKSLGAVIEQDKDVLTITGIKSPKNHIKREKERVIDCNESGSTLRFLVPIALAFKGVTRFIGRGNLGKRPLNTYYEIFDEQGIEYSYKEGVLDLVTSGLLKAGEFRVKGNISSQFITGLMFTLPLLDGDSKIIITTELESKGYLDLTLSAMKDFGIEIINNDYKEFIIKGNQEYISRDYRVEGDYSQAAFFLSGDALGDNVKLLDLKEDSLQGDREVLDILERMGMVYNKEDGKISGKVDELKSTLIDASQCPDIIPVLSAVAALSKGRTEIINAKRLRIKECDRLVATSSQINELSGNVKELPEGMIINGVDEFTGGNCSSYNDHRIAMMLAIAATRSIRPVIIDNMECVEKSYPSFWEDYKSLGGIIDVIDMEK